MGYRVNGVYRIICAKLKINLLMIALNYCKATMERKIKKEEKLKKEPASYIIQLCNQKLQIYYIGGFYCTIFACTS